MDPDWGSSTKAVPRKVKFAPKVPSQRRKKPVLPKVEKVEEVEDDIKAEELMRRYNESSMNRKTKAERKVAPVQVAFGFGGSSNALRSYGAHKGIKKNLGSSNDGTAINVEKEYKEPWDYYTYYPVTVPLRRPYSGNPELLDEEEFEKEPDYDENATNDAAELGLVEENAENNMFLLKFPENLPMVKQPDRAEAREPGNIPKNTQKGAGKPQKTCNLEELPAGFMGKMLVYKSGAVKLKLGDTLYDVSAGLDCVFAQEVVAVNAEEKKCCSVGELHKRASVTPDIDSVLKAISEISIRVHRILQRDICISVDGVQLISSASAMNSIRDRNARVALFDGIEEGGIRASSSYSSHEIDEQENDRAIDGLQDRVIMLKRLSGDIHEEVESHNNMLDRMGNDMDASRGVLSGTMDKFKTVFETKSSRRMVTLVASFVVVFLVVYYLTR
ncbi:hypothetical protein ABFS82_10G083000 [Erythranthe guttata]